VVDEPDASDGQEAGEVGEVRGPLIEDPCEEIVEVVLRTESSSTSKVIAIANTPSLKASSREVSKRSSMPGGFGPGVAAPFRYTMGGS